MLQPNQYRKKNKYRIKSNLKQKSKTKNKKTIIEKQNVYVSFLQNQTRKNNNITDNPKYLNNKQLLQTSKDLNINKFYFEDEISLDKIQKTIKQIRYKKTATQNRINADLVE